MSRHHDADAFFAIWFAFTALLSVAFLGLTAWAVIELVQAVSA